MYAGHFLIEAYGLIDIVRAKSAAGTNFRILLGDPRSEAVRLRGREEGLPSIVDRCRSSLDYLSSTASLPGVQIRTHGTTLYASIYRFDDTMLINSHTYGAYAAQSPVTHLQKVPGAVRLPRPPDGSGPLASRYRSRHGQADRLLQQPAAPPVNSIKPSTWLRPTRRQCTAHPAVRQRQLVEISEDETRASLAGRDCRAGNDRGNRHHHSPVEM